MVPFLLFARAPAQSAKAAAPAASMASPAGLWKTVDDLTGEVKSLVVIREVKGALYGQIEQVYNPPVPNPLCIRCTGSLKDRAVVGLQILWGLHKNGSEWTDGHILDPETGKIYRCSVVLEDGGKILRVRGYIGFSFLGRTQHWRRVP
ncbi:MAG: DUF2147 domain-containing protein [Acidobacteriota bacterium]|nr:DUF2147 domain-containing protein [Acidobacteriota bacterium]